MANPVITQNDISSVVLRDPTFRDATIYFSGADTFAEGTILGQINGTFGTPVAGGTNTGNGTVSDYSVTAPTINGNWSIICTGTDTDGGDFNLLDPDDNVMLSFSLAAGSAAVEAFGLKFTVNDGSTDFAVDDTFTFPISNSGYYTIYTPGASDGTNVPVAILLQDITVTGAGTELSRILVSGYVDKAKLIVDGGTAIGTYEIEKLEDVEIFVESGIENTEQDNS
jgi:hypothetical protein